MLSLGGGGDVELELLICGIALPLPLEDVFDGSGLAPPGRLGGVGADMASDGGRGWFCLGGSLFLSLQSVSMYILLYAVNVRAMKLPYSAGS